MLIIGLQCSELQRESRKRGIRRPAWKGTLERFFPPLLSQKTRTEYQIRRYKIEVSQCDVGRREKRSHSHFFHIFFLAASILRLSAKFKLQFVTKSDFPFHPFPTNIKDFFLLSMHFSPGNKQQRRFLHVNPLMLSAVRCSQ